MLVVITFDESELGGPGSTAACCNEPSGPEHACARQRGRVDRQRGPGGGQIGALLLNPKYIVPGSTDTTGSYNHYSALRSYEDLLGLTTGGADGEGHLGFAAATGLAPFGTDVFPAKLSGAARRSKGSVEPAQRGPVALGVGHVLGGRQPDHRARPTGPRGSWPARRAPARRAAPPCCSARPRWRPTVAPRPMTAWCRTTLPEPASDSSSRVQPSRWVRCPTTQPSPMTVGNPGPAWITVPS